MKQQLENLVALNEKLQKSYFWKPPANASGRRYYEDQNSAYVRGYFNNHFVDCKLNVSCSCKNIYVSRDYKIDFQPVTILEIKKLLKGEK